VYAYFVTENKKEMSQRYDYRQGVVRHDNTQWASETLDHLWTCQVLTHPSPKVFQYLLV